MPRHNPSGPKRSRRASTSRSNSEGNPYTKKSGERTFSKPTEANTERPVRSPQGNVFKGKDKSPGLSTTPGRLHDRVGRRGKDVRGKAAFTNGVAPVKKKYQSDDAGEKRTFKKSYSKASGVSPAFRKEDKRHSGGEEGSSIPLRSKRNNPYRKFDKKANSRYDDKRPSLPSESRSERPYNKFEDKGKRRPFESEGNKKPHDGRAIRSVHANTKQSESLNTGKIRLNKFIANSGVCSRREADELITMGLIAVNGKIITELGYKVNPTDEVRHESKVLRAEKPVYILLNKPKGFLTTTADPQERNTVMHLIRNVVKERVYPVGRLDRNTTGLLLLTNDGDLADKLMHPSYNVKKIYKVDLDRPLTKADAQRILEGVKLEEGRAIVDDLAIVSDDRKTVGLEIHIGWNRVVRRIFESCGYDVVKLDRSVYAGLNKKEISRGEWRFLKKEELVLLKHFQE